MARSDVAPCSWNSPASLAGNTGLYLFKSVSVKQSEWLQNLGLKKECVHIVQNVSAIPAAVTSDKAALHWHMDGQAYHKTSSMKQLVNGESGYVQACRQKNITLNIC